MKTILKLIVMSLVLLVAATSCKTTEENYKAAYDIAVKKNEKGADKGITAIIEKEKRMNEYTVIEGDSVRVITELVTLLDANGAAMKRYGVVVGEYKQVFNARSFRNRINAAEQDTVSPSYVAMSPQKRYYVVYKGFDDKKEASSFMKNKSNFKINVPIAEPWILELPQK